MYYRSEIIEKSNELKCRFALIRLLNQCSSLSNNFFKSGPSSNIESCVDWYFFGKDFESLLKDYDSGIKLNEEFLIKI